MVARAMTASPVSGPRERMVRSAMALICAQGVSGTGVREVVRHAEAPRGSLQHYFPRGKEQLVEEALALAGRTAARTAGRARDAGAPIRPADVLSAMVAPWRTWLTESDYAQGCPVLATVADAAVGSPGLRTAAERAFDEWQDSVEAVLREAGVAEERSRALAGTLVAGLEGAIVMARARRSLRPLDDLVEQLSPFLDGLVASRR
jgi:AcrR family transcriptional regulator